MPIKGCVEDEDEEYKMDETKVVRLKPFIKIAASIAFPGMAFYITALLLQTVNLAFIGQTYTNKSMIEAIGMVNVYLNCTLMSFYSGIIAGVETLCANALASKKYTLMGYYFQRARIVSYSITIFLSIIHYSTIQHVIKLFGLNKEVIEYGSRYCYTCLVYVFFDVNTSSIMRLNNVMNKSHINCVVFVITLALHPIWNYLYVVALDLDVVGTAISFAISRFLGCVLITLYLWFYHPVKKANFWINRKCFSWKGIKEYLRFSIGAAFLEIAEWYGFEIMAIMAIQLGDTDYAVYVLIAELINLLYSVPIGFMIAITILIGQIVTKYPIKQVKKASLALVLFAISTMFCILVVFFILRNVIFELFTKEKDLIDLGEKMLPIVSVNELFDISQNATISIFKGMGKQYLAAGFMFTSIYILTPSYVAILAFACKLKLKGLIFGMGCGYVSATILYVTVLLCCLDFRQAQIQTLKRLKKDVSILNAGAEKEDEEEDEENDADALEQDEKAAKKEAEAKAQAKAQSNAQKPSNENNTPSQNDENLSLVNKNNDEPAENVHESEEQPKPVEEVIASKPNENEPKPEENKQEEANSNEEKKEESPHEEQKQEEENTN